MFSVRVCHRIFYNICLALQQQLIAIGGDHVVRKRLVVVNTDEELHYYVKTGELPEHHG
jgi:hypothetical protein